MAPQKRTGEETEDGRPSKKVRSNGGYQPATLREKEAWKGFCEIESDPVYFNFILKGFGVRGVKVQEIYSLDAASLAGLPNPVYGFIFLFQWTPSDDEKQDASSGTRESGVWFANQIAANSCATVALLNMVTNVPGLDLGKDLEAFKSETMALPPARRGIEVAGFGAVRRVHNSFARKIDMLLADATLESEAEKAEKAKKSKKKQTKRRNMASKTKKSASRSKKKSMEDTSGNAYHFVAYMPVDGHIWKLDGMEKDPQSVASCTDSDWLATLIPILQDLMASKENAGFSLLALVSDPNDSKMPSDEPSETELASNVKYIVELEKRLHIVLPEWKSFAESDPEGIITGPDDRHNLSSESLEQAVLSKQDIQRLDSLSSVSDIASFLEARKKAVEEQAKILRIERQNDGGQDRKDLERVVDRCKDYGPLVQQWLYFLAQNGELKGLVAPTRSGRGLK